MKGFKTASLVMIGTLAAVGSAYAAQPPDVVQSDGKQNSAMGGLALNSLSSGSDNTAVGYATLDSNSSGSYNTAVGSFALSANSTENGNTAIGYAALNSNTSGYANTASGSGALQANTSGFENSAAGNDALHANVKGNNNSALGWRALYSNEITSGNTAVGSIALFADNLGDENTAMGFGALTANTEGNANTATGEQSLYANTTGNYNTAMGYQALYINGTTGNNTAVGYQALFQNTGSNNIALGYQAGFNLSGGNNNIDIGNATNGGEDNTIRIGTPAVQNATYIAGIYGNTLSGSEVVVTSSGQLGVVMSSERFKTDVAPMADTSAKLHQLRPVTFHYKTDPNGNLQYGLIAEEVAQVYPDLVIRDEKGRIDGVRYDELAPILLTEVQRQQQQIAALMERNTAEDARLHQMELQQKTVGEMQQDLAEMRLALSKLLPKDELVARR
jgi:hypothetical protein